MASAEKSESEVVSVELPAPEGWRKKFTPKQGGTPKRNEIIFISPTGEEIKNRRQLDLYLRSHPGGPPPSEFDWGTGDTPRRSARISEKVKTPEAEKPKQASSSSSQKGSKRKKNTEDEQKIEGDGSGSLEIKRKKGTEDDEHKAEGEEAHIAEGDGPKDVDMEETEGPKHNKAKEETFSEGIHCLVGQESAEKTKENTEETAEQHVESQGEMKHELADKAIENDEKAEQDVERSEEEGTELEPVNEASEEEGTELEPVNEAKETQNDAKIFPPASDSEKVVLIEKDDEISDSKKDEVSVCKKDAEILSENGGEKNEVEENVAPKDNLQPEKEVASDSEKVVLIEKDDEISDSKKDEDSVIKKDAEILSENGGEKNEVEENVAPKDNLQPEKEVQENLNDTEVSAAASDSEKVALIPENDAASAAEKDEALVYMKDAEILPESGGKDEQVNAAPEDNLEPGKEDEENLNDTEVSPPASDSEKVSSTNKDDEVSAAEKDEASAFMKGAEILSENGGKKDEEVNAPPEDNFLHNYDDGKMQFDSFSSNW